MKYMAGDERDDILQRMNRRKFLKLCGATALGTAAGISGYSQIKQFIDSRSTLTGRAVAGDSLFESSLDSESEIERFHILTHERNIAVELNPAGEGSVTSIFAPEGSTDGAFMIWKPDDAGYDDPEAMYAQYYVYFPEDAEIGRGTKLPGPAGIYGEGGAGCERASGGSWSARGFAGSGDTPNTFSMDYYVYHKGHGRPNDGYDCGDHFSWDGEYELGRWHEVTQYVQMNTPGQNDGILRAWMNGEKVFEKTDFFFRDEDHPNIGVERYYGPYIYWGGSWGSPKDQNVYFRDLKLTTTEPVKSNTGGSTSC